MPKPKTADTLHQLALWNRAVDLLGGTNATARLLGVTDRTVRGLNSGERPLHDGYLRDISAALIDHADRARELERKLSPTFLTNLTERQQQPGRNAHLRYDRREG